jgi:catechol 2,3-dioxygenase-like lactoylglutathione lyase family enzyme
VILHAPNGSELEIACFTEPQGETVSRSGWADAGIRSITFKVTDIRAMLRRLDDAGYVLVNEVVEFTVEGRSVEVAYVRGPDGVILTLLDESRR